MANSWIPWEEPWAAVVPSDHRGKWEQGSLLVTWGKVDPTETGQCSGSPGKGLGQQWYLVITTGQRKWEQGSLIIAHN